MRTGQGLGTALITGASSGIGAMYADRLAGRGYDLILVARSQERLDEVAKRVALATGRSVTSLAADLNRPTDVARVEAVLRGSAGISVLVNNAGIGATAPLVESDISRMDEMISLNVGALTHLTYAVAPGFVARGDGAIINIASIVAIAPEVLNGVYGASKAYVLAFSQSLHHELSGKGVRVQAVLPGATATDFWNVAGTPVDRLPAHIVMDAGDMVDAALVGFDRGELVTIPSLPDASDWQRFDDARRNLSPNLSHARPAARYLA